MVEIVNGQLRPYPDGDWTGWRPGDDPSKAFVAVNALRLGQDLALWVVDSRRHHRAKSPGMKSTTKSKRAKRRERSSRTSIASLGFEIAKIGVARFDLS
ncbi:MAG TPA: hypothetical protein VH353_01305, partial [Caulobacteraceae bacterium]|nr:hypothetical protein [Caulobacteraceae bacterium]